MAKVRNIHDHGRHVARQRYGDGARHERAPDQQAPQMPEDKHDAKYDNDTGYVWQHCIAEEKPGFDHTKKGK